VRETVRQPRDAQYFRAGAVGGERVDDGVGVGIVVLDEEDNRLRLGKLLGRG
jgi:hypothetical protein